MSSTLAMNVDGRAHRPASGSPIARVLLATNGSAGSDGACRVAYDIVRRTGARLDVVTTVGDRSRGIYWTMTEQLERLWPSRSPICEQLVTDGRATRAIPVAAARTRANLIVLGLGCRATALAVMRRTRTPVLCVEPRAMHAPRRVICAVDGSTASVRAARLGIALLGAGPGHVTCVHARTPTPRHGQTPFDLTRIVRAELTVPPTVELTVLEWPGAAVKLVLDVAAEGAADLITTGSRGESVLARALHGSVSTHLVRDARCSVLVAR